MKVNPTTRGAPLTRWAPCFCLFVAICLAAAPLHADGPSGEITDWLGKARSALATGNSEALSLAARALKNDPDGADENLLMSLAMFWAGHGDDAARYMRRAVSTDRGVLEKAGRLSETMPADDAESRLLTLAEEAGDDAEKCFLTGTLLLLNKDRTRALAFLVRAEELAGTDAQAALLADSDADDRNEARGKTALNAGEWDEAARSFTFAALESPHVAEHYAGLVLALCGDGDAGGSRALADVLYARSRDTTLQWILDTDVPAGPLLKTAQGLELDNPPLGQLKLAALLYFAAGHYGSAQSACVAALLQDKLDDFVHDLQGFMERNNLRGNPVEASQPESSPEGPVEQPDAAPDQLTLEDARRLIRRAEFTDALKILDGFVTEDSDAEVYHLVFICTVGRGELTDAQNALQAWFERAEPAERTRLNAIRELFASQQLFDRWREHITLVRDANPNQGLPRLLNTYVEITRGRYSTARNELVVAKIESPGNALVIELDRLLSQEDLQNDRTPDGVLDDPTPKALLGRADRLFRDGDYEGSKTAYLRAMEADPSLPFLTVGLMRCYFALGDYDNSVRQLQVLLKEQEMDRKEARDFVLLLDIGYDDPLKFSEHIAALKTECDERPLSTTPWLLYGVIQLTRTNADYRAARDALKVWYDNDRSKERDQVLVKLYEYARKRAS